VLAVAVSVQGPPAQAQTKKPEWVYAFDLSCRKFGENLFTKDTKRWGFEVDRDPNTGFGVYINQAGNIGVTSNFGNIMPPLKDSKAPVWVYGLDLKTRKPGEEKFTEKTKTWGVEVFFDNNSGTWIYVVENGNFAVAPAKVAGIDKALEKPQDCKGLHSFDLKCRKGGHKEWDKDTPIYGVEVLQDPNNNNLIYLTDIGTIAVVAWDKAVTSEAKGWEWMHGQDLQSRKVGEDDFSDKTKKFGVEIFRDTNNGNLIYLSETGHLAVAPGDPSLKAPTKDPKNAKFKHGLDLRCRQAGEDTFGPKTPVFAIEIYEEPNTNSLLYLSETGALAAVNKK
jgi:hypothetical protein